jgi:hypothetical protein
MLSLPIWATSRPERTPITFVFARAEAHGQEILRQRSVPVGEVLGVELNGASPSATACAP